MKTIQASDSAGKLDTQELCRDYAGKLNAVCELSVVHHEQDEFGCTLVIHVPAAGVAEQAAKAKLSERLGTIIADLPKPSDVDTSLPETETIESQKAVVDVPKSAKAPKKAS